MSSKPNIQDEKINIFKEKPQGGFDDSYGQHQKETTKKLGADSSFIKHGQINAPKEAFEQHQYYK